jgi:drug/metabolite transporter (DMT)-like permease
VRAAADGAVEGKSLASVHALQVLCAALWGLTFVAGKIAGREATPLGATLWRFVVAGVFLVPLAALVEAKHGRKLLSGLTARDWLGVALSGLTGMVLYNYFFIKGLAMVPASRGSVIVCCSPAIIYLASVPLFGERLSMIRLLGVALSAAGTVWVVTAGRPASALAGGLGRGDLVMLACPLAWTLYSLVSKVVLGRVAPLAANALAVAAAVAIMAAAAPAGGSLDRPDHYGAMTWAALAFLGLGGTALGFTLYYIGIKSLGPHRAAAYINLVPVFGVLAGWALLHERPDAALLVGLALILSGIRLIQKY